MTASARRPTLAAALLAASLVASGCAAGTSTTHSAPAATTARRHPMTPPLHRRRRRHRPHPASSSRRAASLAYSTASNQVVQRQPAPGSCHAVGSGVDSRPDPACTPGSLNPAVTQATIDRTICVAGWTERVRPPESVTEREKASSMAAYGDPGSLGDYEYDHFVPLELGGATNDPRNLWPEPGSSPNPKDTVEDQLRQEVCDGQLSLARAQREIVTNWAKLAPPSTGSRPSRSVSAPQCTLSASYSSTYHDYDVYVHSNQPDQTVTVSDAEGHSDSWHTDGSGYADVYFKSGGYAPGRHVTARVGQASCSTTL